MSREKTEAEKKSEQLLQEYKNSDRQNWGSQALEDKAFMLGAQWETEDAEAVEANNQSALSHNEITPSIDLVVAMLTENNPRWQTVGIESSDIKIASNIADLHSYIWDNSNGTQILENAVKDYEVTGMGALMAYVDPYGDYGKGEIMITDVDPLDIYVNPLTKQSSCQDSPHILVVKALTKEQIKSAFPNFDLEDATEISVGSEYPSSTRDMTQDQVLYPDTVELKYTAIDRYTKIKVKRYHVYDSISEYEKVFTEEDYIKYSQEPAVIVVTSGTETYHTQRGEVNKYLSLLEQMGDTYHYMINPMNGEAELMPGAEHGGSSVPGSTTKIIPTTKNELINEGVIKVDFPLITRVERILTIGGKTAFEDILPIEDYPIVTFMLHSQRNPYPMSDVRLVRPLQEQKNKIASLKMAYITNIVNVKYFVPQGNGKLRKEIEERGGKAGFQVFEYDPELGGVPIPVMHTQLPNTFYQEDALYGQQIQRIIGAYAVADGDAQQAPNTKGGTILIDEYGQRRVNLKRKRVEGAMNQLAKVVCQMIPGVYTEEKVIRIVEPNKKPKEIRFNSIEGDRIINDLSLRFDVKILTASTMPTNKMMRFEILNNAYQSGVIHDPRPVIENLDVPNVDEILEREDMVNNLQQALGQAQEEIKKLQGDLQTANRAEVQAEKKVEVQKFKSSLDKVGNKLESSAMLAEARMSDTVKKKNSAKEKSKTK